MAADCRNDRFGMPDSAFDAALESHGHDNPVLRAGMDVPMQAEVASLPVEILHPIMIDWMWESPSELIPSNEQIRAVIAILRARPDAKHPDVRALIHSCEAYLLD
ncbi:hypothetical protein [Rhodanobacter fulvus]|jgi:hypothetical protein|nr:hypothetical protein [Rhodanobacter fulvus]